MVQYIEKLPENLLSLYNRTGTRDGHGGRAREHHMEMQQIADAEIQKLVPTMVEQICGQVWRSAISELHNVLSGDITSQVELGVKGCKDIFFDQKTQKWISDHVFEAMDKAIRNINLQTTFTIK